MNIQENKQLKDFNTLQLSAVARYFSVVKTIEDVKEVLSDTKISGLDIFILGSGSNTLFSQDYDGIVIKNEIKGIKVTEESDSGLILEVGGGEDWPEFVSYVVSKGWGGVENLSHIPGTVGAAPVQNIAAYGQNFSDVFVSLDYLDLETGELKSLDKESCQLKYRDSIFKNSLKGKTCISKVRIQLSKKPEIDTSYYSIGGRNDSIAKELQKRAQKPYTIEDVSNAVISIRTAKLLDWKKDPTVGSFFINPIISKQKLSELRAQDPELQYYPVDDLSYKGLDDPDFSQEDSVKVPVGRLLDFLGWKGKVIGNCKVHDEWASIFTHNGQASGKEFLEFTQIIREDVFQKMGIRLESEVSIV